MIVTSSKLSSSLTATSSGLMTLLSVSSSSWPSLPTPESELAVLTFLSTILVVSAGDMSYEDTDNEKRTRHWYRSKFYDCLRF